MDSKISIQQAVSDTKAALKHGFKDNRGVTKVPEERLSLDVNVTSAQLDRALKLFLSLATQISNRGGSIERSKRNQFRYSFVIEEEYLHFEIRELAKTVLKKASWGGDRRELVPTGLLSLQLGEWPWVNRSWRDSTTIPLESRLPQIIEEIPAIIDGIRTERIAAEEKSREWEVADQLRRAKMAREKAGKENARHLIEAFQRWRYSRSLDTFLNAMESSNADAGDEVFHLWLATARRAVRGMDPLAEGTKPWKTLKFSEAEPTIEIVISSDALAAGMSEPPRQAFRDRYY